MPRDLTMREHMKLTTNNQLLQTTYSCLKAHERYPKYLQDLCLIMNFNACVVVKRVVYSALCFLLFGRSRKSSAE